jgi:quinol monooxygenase YgiN
MNARQLFVIGASVLASALSGSVAAKELQGPYVQVAEIEIDPAQLEAYKAAVREHIETAIRIEPGVLVLYAVSEQDNPTHVKVFEVYRDTNAYKSHLESDHFKKYKATTEKMVKSLMLVRTTPIVLGAKSR